MLKIYFKCFPTVLQRFYHQQNQLRDKQERRNQETDETDPFFSHIPKYRSPYSSSPPIQTYQQIPAHPIPHRQANIHQPIYSRSPPTHLDPTPLRHHQFGTSSQIPTAHYPHQSVFSNNSHQTYQHRHASEPRATSDTAISNSPKHIFFYNASPGAQRRNVLPTSCQATIETLDSSQLPPSHPVYSRSPPDRRVYPTVGHPVAKSIIQSHFEEDTRQTHLENEPKPDKGGERLRDDHGECHIYIIESANL